MARPRTPTNVLKLRGADKVHPERMKERADEPKPKSPLGSAPRHLNDAARKCWNEIKRLAPEGVFGNCDRWAVEIAAVLMAEFREMPLEMPAARLARLDALLGRFGMTPADRSKVTALPSPKKSRFDD